MSEELHRGPGRPRKDTVTNADLQGTTAKEDVKTPEQLELEKLREEVEALRATSRVDAKTSATADVSEQTKRENLNDPDSLPDKILIHFVNDGLTFLGEQTYRGQEREFDTRSQAYKDTCDKTGWSFLSLRNDPQGQEARWGKEYFREGPWTGGSYADAKFETLKRLAGEGNVEMPTVAELAELDRKERERRRSPQPLPTVPTQNRQRSGY